ncbi:MAG: septum formation initiator family protein [Bdellovibrionaceae bacterium]|nr:septum formation initiator family protein [Pseudobdellovibrionaceae bacterium]
MKKIKKLITQFLYQPYLVFLFCLVFLFINLFVDKTMFQVFHSMRNLQIVQNRIKHLEDKNEELKEKIKKANNPDFIEKELRKRLDYAEEGDLIFLFPENL